MTGASPRRRLRQLAGAAPLLVFAALAVLTWKRWILPFQDHPREIATAARLADGQVLYRDVTWSYGPVAPYLDALALLVLPRRLETLLAVRLVFALLGVEALRRLARRLASSAADPGAEGSGAAVASLVVALCAFQGLGGTWAFPYAAASLEASVLLWWSLEWALSSRSAPRSLAVGLAAGLAAASKLEYVVASIGPLVALWAGRPRREVVRALVPLVAIPAAAYGIPLALLPAEHLRTHGVLVAFPPPESWRALYRAVVWGDTPGEFLRRGVLEMLVPSALLLGAAFAAARRPGRVGLPLGALAAVAGASAAIASPRNGAFHALLPGAALAFLWDAARAWRARRVDAADAAAVATGLAMLPALVRQPFRFLFSTYGSLSAPLAVVVSFGFLMRRARRPAVLALFAAGLAAGQAFQRVVFFRAEPRAAFDGARGSFLAIEGEARLLRDLVAAARATAPGAAVEGFPEGGLVAFLADRRSPFVDTQFHPGVQDERSESEMISVLRTRPPDLLFVRRTSFAVWGGGDYGGRHLPRFFSEVRRRYGIAGRAGEPPDDALLLVPRKEPDVPANGNGEGGAK